MPYRRCGPYKYDLSSYGYLHSTGSEAEMGPEKRGLRRRFSSEPNADTGNTQPLASIAKRSLARERVSVKLLTPSQPYLFLCDDKISCEPNHAYQNAYQACTFGTTLVLRWSTISSISLYSSIINPCATSTYKQQIRTVDPKVEGSSPFGLVQERRLRSREWRLLFNLRA